MATPLSALGSRYEERLADAVRAKKREQPLTPGELVTRYAEELALQDKLAQQLGLALVKALRRISWAGAQRFKVEVTPDFRCNWYVVRIADDVVYGPGRGRPQTYIVDDETLAKHTASVSTFHTWIHAVADRLLVMFDPERESILDSREEATTHLEEYYAKRVKAEEELLSFGFRRHDQDRTPSEAEIAEAIASIRQAFDTRSDP